MNAIITGASSGIGASIAETFAQLQINLFLTGRNQEKLEKVVNRLKEFKIKVIYATGDVTNPKDCERIYLQAKQAIGSIDILIASAGVGYFDLLENFSEKDYAGFG